MPQRRTGTISHVVKAKLKASGYTNIEVIEASKEHLTFWDQYVQKPYINTMPERADCGWNWLTNTPFIMRVARALNQAPQLFSIVMEKDKRFIPLGLVLVVNKYPFVKDLTNESTFLWYLTSAPEDFLLEHLSKDELPSVGKITLDIGVTASFQNQNDGRVGLHADPKGGDKLIRFYKRCKLEQLDKTAKLPLSRRLKKGGNDGRYFYFDSSSALEFSQSLDSLRA
ncbi:hypothetical protein [Vibrio parahaemolyticus]|uniref:hypothetical protein n=1 Tax=Vibrio parahaemolyticus TaxID=670 RepID=UPI0005420CBC|nr:hypothetical protein [Vibrio parahaemolyticus]EGR3356014.1 hypothetical protein [Vibrio parahaemolyticus]EJG1852757.1 hypothetical protein [Vibrio parahaemolyticus]KHF15865.1 hypothetical protein PO80_09015 [Vibrio parahaemolyticus]MBE3888615.1 hypothetical protein [Vibrio parahaemolyticus]MBE4318695.1 hypothetical protein [Vibrio parahaemolyticus]